MIRGEQLPAPNQPRLARGARRAIRDRCGRRLLERCRWAMPARVEWNDAAIREAGESLAPPILWPKRSLALDCPRAVTSGMTRSTSAAFVWAEVESRARRVLWEVHTLASAYGWSEAETLALERGTARDLSGGWCRHERLLAATGAYGLARPARACIPSRVRFLPRRRKQTPNSLASEEFVPAAKKVTPTRVLSHRVTRSWMRRTARSWGRSIAQSRRPA